MRECEPFRSTRARLRREAAGQRARRRMLRRAVQLVRVGVATLIGWVIFAAIVALGVLAGAVGCCVILAISLVVIFFAIAPFVLPADVQHRADLVVCAGFAWVVIAAVIYFSRESVPPGQVAKELGIEALGLVPGIGQLLVLFAKATAVFSEVNKPEEYSSLNLSRPPTRPPATGDVDSDD